MSNSSNLRIHSERSLGPTAARMCIILLTNSGTSVLEFSVCLSLSSTAVDRFSTATRMGKSVLPEAYASSTVSVLGGSRWYGWRPASRSCSSSARPGLFSSGYPLLHLLRCDSSQRLRMSSILRSRSLLRSGLGIPSCVLRDSASQAVL